MNKFTLVFFLTILAWNVNSSLLKFKAKQSGTTAATKYSTKNLVKNGNFASPQISNADATFPTTVDNWTLAQGPKFEMARVHGYNNNWPTLLQGLELDSDANYTIKQEIALEAARKCLLKFQYSGRTSHLPSSGIIAKFNGDVLLSTTSADNADIKSAEYVVNGREGLNSLEFAGAGTSDGVGAVLTNISLNCACLS
jgi:hypothetical protein